ncbi:MAG: aldo/keto reductase [Hyphomonadaceae bacterium]
MDAVGGPRLKLNNGKSMPQFGLGVWQATPDETAVAVAAALDAGYRLIDTAAVYGNEDGVGRGIAGSSVPREEIFVITKLWLNSFEYEKALRAFDKSMARLGLDYLDLYLLHWPVPRDGDLIFEAYRALEKLLADGRVRAIGVCNHTPKLLDKLLARVTVTPVLNQIELHPYCIQKETRAADAKHNIVTQSWSPIGGSSGSGGGKGMGGGKHLLSEPVLAALGEKHGKTPAQIVLRWHVQNGLSVIPKSANPKRIAENIDIFDFALSAEDMAAIDGLDTGQRGGPDPEDIHVNSFNR